MDSRGGDMNEAKGVSDIDPTTGLGRYPRFLDRWMQVTTERKEEDPPVSMCIIDLDHFGKLNDVLGVDQGNAMLKTTAEFLVDSLGDFAEIFRYGGDAFSLIVPATEKEQAFFRVEQTRVLFAERMARSSTDEAPSVTFSAGIATFPDDGPTGQEVVRKANEAMYRAKNSGRNRVCLAREERMTTKTSHYTQGQLQGLSRLAKRMNVGEAVLLREALDDLLRKYNA